MCGFSSTLKTAALAGGARYRPTTSRILSISSGSGETLNVSVRQGCSPNARQIRSTLDGEMPARAASSRFDQCVAPSGSSSSVRTTTSSTWASVMVRGTPGRGSSDSPSSRSRRKRARHLLTVLRLTPSRAATARLLPPCAQASTIRARRARPCAALRRLTQFSNLRRSSSDSTSGSSLVSPIPPAERNRHPGDSPGTNLGHKTTHEVTDKLKTRSLAAWLLLVRRRVLVHPRVHRGGWGGCHVRTRGDGERGSRWACEAGYRVPGPGLSQCLCADPAVQWAGGGVHDSASGPADSLSGVVRQDRAAVPPGGGLLR